MKSKGCIVQASKTVDRQVLRYCWPSTSVVHSSRPQRSLCEKIENCRQDECPFDGGDERIQFERERFPSTKELSKIRRGYATTYINIDVEKTSICTRLFRQLANSWPPMSRRRMSFSTKTKPVGFLWLSWAYQNRYWKAVSKANLSGAILIHSAS